MSAVLAAGQAVEHGMSAAAPPRTGKNPDPAAVDNDAGATGS
jgi:hypothetical protein